MRPTSASVVICCFTERRWNELNMSIASVQNQSHPAHQIVVVVDYNSALEARLLDADIGVSVVANRYHRGLSGARNTGVEETTGEVIVFLDDDAWAEPEWLDTILAAYDSPEVAGVGGAIEPIWPDARPAFFPPEFDWVIGCSYAGMEKTTGRIRNLIGANMSLRRDVLLSVGSFDTSVGRTASKPLGGEDTELCIRVLQSHPTARFVIEDSALVHHHVSSDRTEWAYFLRRCYAEGKSKAHVSRLRGASHGLSRESEHALKVIPAALGRNLLRGITRFDSGSFARAAAIIAGMATTTAGLVGEWVRIAMLPDRSLHTSGGTVKERPIASGTSAGGTDWVYFDFHGLVRMRVEKTARSLPNLIDMMRPFIVDDVSGYEITVGDEPTPMEDPSCFEDHLRYTDNAVAMLGSNVQVAELDDGVRISGTRELLTTVLPVLDWLMTQRGAGMIHAATFAYKGHGVFMPAWGGVGKTSTIAKLSKYDDVAFMGDDWGFISESGKMLGYAKPMFMKPHHKPIYPHVFKGGRKPLVPRSLTKYVHSVSTLFHPVVTKYPRLAAFTRKWSPEHMMVTPSEALPHTKIATCAPLTVSVFVERHDGAKAEFTPVTEDWLVARMVGNFNAELSGPSREVITALGATGFMPLDKFYDAKAQVFSKAVSGKPAYLLRVPAAWSADEASDDIVTFLFKALAAAGVTV